MKKFWSFIDNIREFNNLTNLDMNPFDKRTLNRNLRKFEQRMKKINKNRFFHAIAEAEFIASLEQKNYAGSTGSA